MIPRGRVLDALRGRSVHVVGASGAEGVAVLLYLVGECGLEGVVAHDFSADPVAFARSFRRANTSWDRRVREDMLKRLRRLPVTFELGDRYLAGIRDADVIFAGQNWFNYPSNLPGLPDAVAAGAALYGVVDLAMALFGGLRIGITGSNGKSTTSALVRHLLTASSDAPVLQGGNDRDRQVTLERLASAGTDERLVWEVSNRHLRDRDVHVDIGVLTNITHNHIEDHGSWEAYVAAKRRLPTAARTPVVNAVDPVSRELLADLRAAREVWSYGDPEQPGPRVWMDGAAVRYVTPGAEGTLDASTFALPGAHNRVNLCGAVATVLAAGGAPDRIEAGIADFAPLAGRLEQVAERDGVRWIYDIQATTAPAAEAGILATDGPQLLIVGGEDKGMDYTGMADAAAARAMRIFALPGSGTDAFLVALDGRVPVRRFTELDALLEAARETARPGWAVLLSPGCAFFHREFLAPGKAYGRRVAAVLERE